MSSGTTSRIRGLRITRLEPASASGWLLNFASADKQTFFAAVELLRGLPESRRRWLPEERAWWVQSGALMDLCEQLPDLAEALAAWRGRSHSSAGQRARRGPRGETKGETRPGRRRSAARSCVPLVAADAFRGVPADIGEAFATIHLLPTAPADLVKWAQKLAAKRAHPDVGGSHKRMLTINLAAKQAQLWAEQHDAGAGQTGAA